MDRRQEIKELIPAVYNISSDRTSEGCTGEACKCGKCICMDGEQAALLQGILIKEDFIAMDIREGKTVFRNIQQGACQDLRCQWAVQEFVDWLIPHRDRIQRDKLECLIDSAVQSGQADFVDMLGSVPAVYMINSYRELEDRESLINLCVYASCPQRYLDQLLRAVICCTIGCYLKGNSDEWSAYAEKTAEMFGSLNDLFEHSEERIEELLEVMDDYYIRLGRKGGRIHFAQNMLGECRDRMRMTRDRKLAVCEGEKSRQWYRVLKKIFEIMGIPAEKFPELTFVDSPIYPSDYDDVIQVLDEVMGERDKACGVLKKISDVFLDGKDLVDEEVIQQLRRIAA